MQRVAVDIGGTFTDIVHVDDDARQTLAGKVRSTPEDIGQAVLDAVKKIGVDMAGVSLFVHGTTAGLNAVAQRRGAKVGLLTTAGFTDILEMTRGSKKDPYNNMWRKPEPLVPRCLRRGVGERTGPRGEIFQPVDADGVKAIVEEMKEAGVETLAVCLINAYANPANELKVAEIIEEAWPGVSVSLSHRVAPEIREYERTSTAVINAYVEKAVGGYLDRLGTGLEGAGFKGQLLVLGPGGLTGVESARQKVLHTIASGTVGGAAGAAHLARLCGVNDVVTMDVGGTSFDISVIKDGANLERHLSELMGFPILMPGIEVRSIGAGGGSIARVDAAGLLTVGPDSAGANPGPMSYGLGGTEPTVTDAALVNGLIDPDYFLGGDDRLDLDLAVKGVSIIADKLGLSLNKAADGILEVARNNMNTTTTEILVGQGYDPRDFALMTFGGAGGIFASGIARDMSIGQVIVPASPGVFCARGILTMNLVHTYSQAYTGYLGSLDLAELEDIFRQLEQKAGEVLAAEGMAPEAISFVRSLDMAYAGQRHYVEAPVPAGALDEAARKEIGEAFGRLHETKYGHRVEAPITTVNIRLKAVGAIPRMPEAEIAAGREVSPKAIKPGRRVYLDGGFVDCGIYERDGLLCGNTIEGPAIVEEPFHTTVVMPGQTLSVDRLGNLVIATGRCLDE